MRILKMEIESFGKLEQFTLTPGSGLTLIRGDNESGKSTILAFLRFVLYGFPRKNGPEGEERERRLSWRTRTAGGRLTLEAGGAQYRILRRCMARGNGVRGGFVEELSVIALPGGTEVALEGKTPGEHFLGLPVELYDGSLYLAQSDAERVSSVGVSEAVSSFLFGEGATLRAEDARNRLQEARRTLRHRKGRGGRIPELEDRLAAVEGELALAREGFSRLGALQTQVMRCRTACAEKRAELAQVLAAFERIDIDRTLALCNDAAAAAKAEAACLQRLERAKQALATALACLC